MDKISFFFIAVAAAIGLSTCQKDEIHTREYPTIATSEVTNITSEGATFSATITSGNPGLITEYGFVWGSTDNLTLEDDEKIVIDDDLNENDFSAEITFALIAMKDYHVRSYVKSGNYVIYGNHVTFKSLGSQAPVIEDFEPKSATWGDTVTISGRNFSSQKSFNLIYFGNTVSRPFYVTDKTLKVLVPDALSANASNIAVETYGNRCTFNEPFNLITPYHIFSSNKTDIFWNDTLQISGDFPGVDDIRVIFSNTQAEIVDKSINLITVKVPPSLPYTDSIGIRIIINNHGIDAPFKVHMIKPLISSIKPAQFGWEDTIIINGLFNTGDGLTKIFFGDIQSNLISIKKEKIICIVPITVNHEAAFKATIGKFLYDFNDTFSLNGPQLTSALPKIAVPGQLIQLKGKYFKNGATYVKINNNDEFMPENITSTSCQFHISDFIESGPVKIDLRVYNKSVSSSTILSVAVPSITDISPREGFYGDILTIYGENFNTDNLIVKAEDAIMPIISATSSELKVRIPYETPGQSYIYVISDTKEIMSPVFFRVKSPIVTSISSTSVKYNEVVTITGDYFNPQISLNSIQLGPEYCEIVSASINELKFKLPIYFSGTYSLSILTGGRWAEYNAINYISPWRVFDHLNNEQAFGNAIMIDDALLVFGGNNMQNYYQRFSFQGGDHQVFINAPLYNVLNGVAFNINGFGYIGLGYSYPNSYYQNFYKFEPFNRIWTRLTDFQGGPRNSPFYFSIGNDCYIGSGVSSDGVLFNDLWNFNSSTEEWTRKSNCPFMTASAKAFVVNNTAYVLSGKELWLYNSLSDNWTRKAGFPGDSRYFSAGFVINNEIYYGTGTGFMVSPVSYTQALYDFWRYNSINDSWEELCHVPIGIYGGFGVTVNGKGYLSGGYQTKIIEYDPAYE